MERQTITLLRECSSGCKMALESMDQILEYVDDEMLEHTILEARQEHEKLEKESGELLRKAGGEEKEPGLAAQAFSRVTTDVKLMMNGGNCQIAKLLMDGCNMGIQSVSECRNQNSQAAKEARDLAARLIRSEEEFMKRLRVYL